ncbi:MAG TPA: cell division ATPase MinD [Candidatus Nanoarchaeia archaeon]|nr:cell division ATPase MinD [Candidatus Nanoarchaeia archaeon]
MSKIVCVASGKGGVGKTTSVVNLGSALSKFGYDTIIVDGNVNTPDMGLHLGMPSNGTSLQDVLKNHKSIFESVYLHPNGTKVVPSSINMWGLLNLSRNKLNEIKKLKGYCDLILLDCSPGINDEAEACIKASDEVLIVTNPEIPSVTDALKTVMLARKNGKTVIGAIINKKLGKDYEMSDANVSEFLGIPILSAVPDDEKVRESISTKKAVVDLYPNNKASIGFKKAAARIVGQEYTDLEKTGLIGRLFSFLRK